MRDVHSQNFGLLIAFVLPGFTLLLGLAEHLPIVRDGLGAAPDTSPTVGGFLYMTLAAVTLGLLVSTVRWLLVDTLLYVCGLRSPLRALEPERTAQFDIVVQQYYRHYQFHANLLVALPIAGALWQAARDTWQPWTLALVVILELILAAGAWDTLAKCYRRLGEKLEGGETATRLWTP